MKRKQDWTFGRDWTRYEAQRLNTLQSSVKTQGALLKYMRGLVALSYWLEAAIGNDVTAHQWMVFESPIDLYQTLSVIGLRWSPTTRRWGHDINSRPRTANELAKLKSVSKLPEWLQRYVMDVSHG